MSLSLRPNQGDENHHETQRSRRRSLLMKTPCPPCLRGERFSIDYAAVCARRSHSAATVSAAVPSGFCLV